MVIAKRIPYASNGNKKPKIKITYPYCSYNVSPLCHPLGQAMSSFYEATKITAKYEHLCVLLAEIQQLLSNLDNKFVSNDEKLFIEYARKEFQDFIPFDNSDKHIIEIINWCLKHGLLQQAVTMTAEWLPRYLLWSNIITISDKSLIDDCEKRRHPWEPWVGYLFKTYANTNLAQKQETSDEIGDLSVKTLRAFIKSKNYDYLKIMKAVKGKNLQLDSFLSNLVQLGLNKPGVQFPTAIYRLPVTNPIRIVCRNFFCQTDAAGFERALKANFKGTTPTEFVLNMVEKVKSDVLVELFGLPLEAKARTAKSDDDVVAKIENRKLVFSQLFDSGKISVPDKEKFLELVVLHIHIVEFYRNRMNHGVIEFKGIEGNKNIIDKVYEALALIKALKAMPCT